MADEWGSPDYDERDERGRFRPGRSGNPRGRPRSPRPDAVNSLADQALQTVLQHDLAAVRAKKTEPRERRQALDRLARLSGRRVISEQRIVVDEAGVDAITDVLAHHITDPDTLFAISEELEALT